MAMRASQPRLVQAWFLRNLGPRRPTRSYLHLFRQAPGVQQVWLVLAIHLFPTADRATTKVHGPRLQEEETNPAQQRSNNHVRFTTPTPETPSLDESLEYCIGNVLLFWKPPSVFFNCSPSNFTVEGVCYSSMEQFIMAEQCKLFGDLATRECILGACRTHVSVRDGAVPPSTSTKEYGRPIASISLW